MALKDWKKDREQEELSDVIIAWKKRNNFIFIIDYPSESYSTGNLIKTRLFSVQMNGKGMWDFKTKSQALTYAKDYMRKH